MVDEVRASQLAAELVLEEADATSKVRASQLALEAALTRRTADVRASQVVAEMAIAETGATAKVRFSQAVIEYVFPAFPSNSVTPGVLEIEIQLLPILAIVTDAEWPFIDLGHSGPVTGEIGWAGAQAYGVN